MIHLTVLTFVLSAGATPADDHDAWQFSRPILLDTTKAGADVAGDVANFPLAIPLSAATFDFTQTKADGADLRFATTDGAALPFHLEHWDVVGKSALAWVKVPKVLGNKAGQSVTMYWGNATTAAAGDSKKVFDTADGFVGVWHLAEAPNSAIDGYQDATANSAHGTGVNLKAGEPTAGRVGRGLILAHAEAQWVKVESDKRKLFDLTNNLTFSIWAKAKSYANKEAPGRKGLPGYETMFAKGDNSWRLQKFGIKSWHKPPAELIEICVEKAPRGDLCVVGKTDMVTDKWFHFTGIHDHPKARVYVNGVLDKESTFADTWKSDDHPVGIGNQSQFPQQGRSWDGTLDEARVLNVVKSADWIKLDYESQREGQKLWTFGAVKVK